jgi:hypothetical protein
MYYPDRKTRQKILDSCRHRPNRLLKILEAAGFRIDKEFYRKGALPLNLDILPFGRKRIAGFIRNTRNDYTLEEIDFLTVWLGLDIEDLFVPEGRDPETETIRINSLNLQLLVDPPIKRKIPEQSEIFEKVS